MESWCSHAHVETDLALALVCLLAAACSSDDEELSPLQQVLADSIHSEIASDMATDEEFAGLIADDDLRCFANGAAGVFSDARLVEIGLDAESAVISPDDVFDEVEITDDEASEMVEFMRSCIDWEAFLLAGIAQVMVEEGMSEEGAQCLVDNLSEESIDGVVDSLVDSMSLFIVGGEDTDPFGSSFDDAALFPLMAEIFEGMGRCLTPEDMESFMG